MGCFALTPLRFVTAALFIVSIATAVQARPVSFLRVSRSCAQSSLIGRGSLIQPMADATEACTFGREDRSRISNKREPISWSPRRASPMAAVVLPLPSPV